MKAKRGLNGDSIGTVDGLGVFRSWKRERIQQEKGGGGARRFDRVGGPPDSTIAKTAASGEGTVNWLRKSAARLTKLRSYHKR